MAKVLIVDDERSIRETLSEFVKELGHEVFTAADAPEAIDVVDRSRPDVVVCDIVLPGPDGISVLEHIRRASIGAQVIMVTGEPTVETAADAVRQTAFDYLAKPVSRNDIQDVVTRALLAKQRMDEDRRDAEDGARYRELLEEEVDRKGRALLASQEDYRLLIENANEAVFIAQGNRLRFANPKTLEITERSLPELLSMPFVDLIHPEDRSMVVGRYRKRLAGETVEETYQFRIVRPNGETRWIEIRPVLVQWEGEAATLNFASDVTVPREAQNRLLESERKWRELFENLRDGWVSTDMDGHFLECNRSFEELIGYTADELKSLTYQDLTPERWHAFERDVVENLILGRGYSGVYQKEYIRKNGTVFPVELSSYLVRDESGQPVGMWGLARDISVRVAAAEALEESQARYRALFENSPISLWQEDYSETKRTLERLKEDGVDDLEAHLRTHPEVVDECIKQIRVVDVNQATVELHAAKSKEDMLGHLSTVIPPEARENFIEQLLAIADGKTSYEGTGTDRRLDGSRMEAAVRWTVAPGYEDSLARILVSKIDITATVEAEAALQAALDGTVRAIGLTTEMRDPYTAGHQRRATELAVAIAEELYLPEEVIDGIRAAGLMHDIGKLAVPAEILSKPSALTDVEMSLIRAHPTSAFDILKTVAFPWPVAEIVLQHHERLDGSGYPQGLKAGEIRPEAKILCVADVIEAMASHRPYRAALGIGAALEEIEMHRGTRYAPDVVDACVRLFREKGFAFSVDEDTET